MNDLLNKWERKIGRYAISNLSMWIIVAYVIGYMLFLFAPRFGDWSLGFLFLLEG